MSRVWIPKTFEQAYKRAAGRRRYHARRRRARDERQLVIMGILVQLHWRSYGFGRILAEALSVDPATISRDIKYIRKFRVSLVKGQNVSEEFADAVIQHLVAAEIHPRLGYSWTYEYLHGISSLTVSRGYAYARGFRRLARQKN